MLLLKINRNKMVKQMETLLLLVKVVQLNHPQVLHLLQAEELVNLHPQVEAINNHLVEEVGLQENFKSK